MLANLLHAIKYDTPRIVFVVVVLLISVTYVADVFAVPRIEKVRFYTAPNHTRVVLDLTTDSKYEVIRYSNPERIAINVVGGTFVSSQTIKVNDGIIHRIRRNSLETKAQVVLDLTDKLLYRDS